MFNEDTDVIFPPRVISHLLDLRTTEWQALAKRIYALPDQSEERLAFVLMMVRLGNCQTCHADSFRAMRGCTQCAVQTIRRFRGSDKELLKLYTEAHQEVIKYRNNSRS